MLGAELYDWLKFGHILMAIIWVGGAITLQLLAIRIVGGTTRCGSRRSPGRPSSSARASSRRPR
ncbi:MAG: hypothetical protein ACRDGW_02965 [Actinomycetota bacterium]